MLKVAMRPFHALALMLLASCLGDERAGSAIPDDAADDASPVDSLDSSQLPGRSCPADSDRDGDGICDSSDNCPEDVNADQADLDQDGMGDACDRDIDGDGLSNPDEGALGTDPFNTDTDFDGADDHEEARCRSDALDAASLPLAACSPGDYDGDGISNFKDNCRYTPNPDQQDSDNDIIGDACDCVEVDAIIPNSGPVAGGNTVTIIGSCLAYAVPAFGIEGSREFENLGFTALVAEVPPARPPPGLQAASPGPVDVSMKVHPDGLIRVVDGYTYTDAPAPPCELGLQVVAPTYGANIGGGLTVITGDCFVAGMTITLAGKSATSIQVLGPNTALFETPEHATSGAVDVTITTPAGQSATLAQSYIYGPAPPACEPNVTAVVPSSGPTTGGNLVTFVGDCFVDGTKFRLNGQLVVAPRILSPTRATGIAPPSDTTGLVAVKTLFGKTVSRTDDAYTYHEAAP